MKSASYDLASKAGKSSLIFAAGTLNINDLAAIDYFGKHSGVWPLINFTS